MIMAIKPEFLASKKDILVALATVLVAILRHGRAIKILCLCYACSLVNVKAKLALFPFFWGPSLIAMWGSGSGGNTVEAK